jgi:hypothetical protein
MPRLRSVLLAVFLLVSTPAPAFDDATGAEALPADPAVALEMFRQEAKRRGLYDAREIAKASPARRDALAVRRLIMESARPVPVAESDVRARYDAIVRTLGPQEYRATLLAFGEEAQARHALDLLRSGGALASPSRGGNHVAQAAAGVATAWYSFPLPPAAGHTNGLPLPVAEILVRLQPGMYAAAPVADGGTWYVVRSDEVRPTVVPTYAQVGGRIRQLLERQAAERAAAAFVARLIRENTADR